MVDYNAQYIGGASPGLFQPQQQQTSFNDQNYSGGGNLNMYNGALAQATNASGQVDYPMLQRLMGLTNDQMNSYIATAGQSAPWLSPDELRAKTNALETSNNLGSSSGGASGGQVGGGISGGVSGGVSGGASGQLGGGLLGGGAGFGGAPTGGGPGGISGFPNIGSGGISNYMPNGMPNQQVGSNQVGGGQVPMMQSTAQNGLQQYYNTPGYQLTNGQGAVNQFQTSPGYQFAVDQALGQVQRQGASRGLLDSGAGLRAMTDRAHGMANQEFNNWQQNQQGQYNQYQNRLAGLAGGPTGAEMAYGTGQGMAGNAMQTGSNIGSILANQGNSLFGGITGAGGAQAQNITQAGNMQAQILGSNLQTQMMLAALAGGQR
jgi:hypothetical protein